MSAQRRLTLAVVSAGTAMLLLDVTVVNVALPVIATTSTVSGRRAETLACVPKRQRETHAIRLIVPSGRPLRVACLERAARGS